MSTIQQLENTVRQISADELAAFRALPLGHGCELIAFSARESRSVVSTGGRSVAICLAFIVLSDL